nr:MAG TPA: REGULATOR OF RIBOSOME BIOSYNTHESIS, RIBOSOME, 5S RNP, RIBOSOME ASSEMBLY [Caudoviricetes sp.]DAQ12236.1 MAG TPA: REGULATOR OF RIBOSOME BIOSYNTHESIS, RIBOSOME, 5S RNP, RIBOSOME ASSEMBLY [Caudoviricetes sp.]
MGKLVTLQRLTLHCCYFVTRQKQRNLQLLINQIFN